ncbi:MAG: murein biosynthesis integral membrane protein MurJ, partial [Propionibacteriaceae bacterium]|nr:murein biosynthesis integral membrane protein MurJ [Propionibacteriaceae bacterium]
MSHAATVEAKAIARGARVAHNSAQMAVGTMVSRALGFVRVMLLALCLGVALPNDAFSIAQGLPQFLFVIISTGAVTAVFVPQITKAMARADGGEDFINRLMTLALLFLAGCTVLAVLATPWLTDLMVSDAADAQAAGYLQLATLLAYWCIPQLPFYGLFAVLGQVLNARGSFRAFAWAPALANVVQVAALGLFYWVWGYQGDVATFTPMMAAVLGGGATLGIAVQALVLLPPLLRDGFRFKLRFGWRGMGFGAITKMTAWAVAAVSLTMVMNFVISWALTAARGGLDDVL